VRALPSNARPALVAMEEKNGKTEELVETLLSYYE
jgi:hypothetical protein